MRTAILYIESDTVSLIQLLAQEDSNGHAPLSKTTADKNDERRSMVKSGWDKLGGKAAYLWVTPCLPNESVQQRCNLSEQSQAGRRCLEEGYSEVKELKERDNVSDSEVSRPHIQLNPHLLLSCLR